MAKDPKTDVKPAEEIVADDAAPKGIPRLYILLGMASLILFQTMLLAFMLPSSGGGTPTVVEGNGPIIPNVLPRGERRNPDDLEKPFGKPEGEKFQVQDVDRIDPSKMSGFSCSVWVVIKKSDEKAFDKIYETNVRRIESLIQTILRESSSEERAEPSLLTIRNRIKRRAGEGLDIPFIIDILINDAQTESM